MTIGPKSAPPARQRDPTARRMLADLLALEGSPWPEARPEYADALLAFATRCERIEAQAEMYRWARRELGGYLVHRDPRVRECRADALADAVATLPGLLLRFRAGLDDHRRPNLVSMLRAALLWASNDMLESRYRRHDRRERPARLDHEQAAVGRPDATLLIREVRDLLAGGARTSIALWLIGLGHAVAEAARQTGASRQAIYRARDALRAVVDDEGDA